MNRWALVTLFVLICIESAVADIPIPQKDFPADRYQAIWLHSPFLAATPAAPVSDTPSPYKLVGVSRVGGVAYASIIDSSDSSSLFLEQYKPAHGLTLLSIEAGRPGAVCSAVVIANGQRLNLQTDNKLATMAPQPTAPMPASGAPPFPQFLVPGKTPPVFHIRQPINVPSKPQ
jgi:hypothetical protein